MVRKQSIVTLREVKGLLGEDRDFLKELLKGVIPPAKNRLPANRRSLPEQYEQTGKKGFARFSRRIFLVQIRCP